MKCSQIVAKRAEYVLSLPALLILFWLAHNGLVIIKYPDTAAIEPTRPIVTCSRPLMTKLIVGVTPNKYPNAFSNWLNLATNLSQYNQQAESLAESTILALGRHQVIQKNYKNGIESLDPEVDLIDLRNDDELMAIVTAMRQTQGIQRLFMSMLQNINKELQQLLLPLTE